MEAFGRGVAGQGDRAHVEAGNGATAEMLASFDDTTLLAARTHAPAGRADVRRLTADPSLWPAGVEELLRFISPTTLTGATATEDVEADVVRVPAGARRALVFAAANRDPGVFVASDAVDLTRSPNPHLAFSAGPHYCVGAPLARLHGQVALDLLFRRYPDLYVVDGPEWLGSVPIRQVDTMTIDWPVLWLGGDGRRLGNGGSTWCEGARVCGRGRATPGRRTARASIRVPWRTT